MVEDADGMHYSRTGSCSCLVHVKYQLSACMFTLAGMKGLALQGIDFLGKCRIQGAIYGLL